MRAGCWWRLVAQNGFRIAPSRLHVALGVSLFTPINDAMAWGQWLLFRRKIEQTKIVKQPIFILGHWRSGTTLLHELLVTDPHFASPNTFQCFAPWHFLLSEPLMLRFGNFLLPKKRPMDNMEAGWRLPQEDEFALMNLGLPTPYLRIAFPQTQPEALEYLDMQGLSEAEQSRWSKRFTWFIKVLTYHYGGKQLILKSPPHTGRIALLAKLFPEAKFIHLTRDPRKLYSSTLRLWRSLDEVQSLQRPGEKPHMERYVTECLNRMYRGYEQAKADIPADQITDLRYEDLVADPLPTVRKLYADLSLGDFADIEPELTKRLADHESYRPNRHQMDAALERHVLRQWADYANTYGYEAVPPPATSHAEHAS